jgi:chloramphenicol 3-O phosphotransferase
MQPTERQIIIILNGVGSSGKSSTARALQEIATVPLLHFSMDSFLDMLPEKLFDHPDGIVFKRSQIDGSPAVSIEVGIVCRRLLSGMRQSVVAMAQSGNSLVVDDVMLGNQANEYRALLKGYCVRFVRFTAPLDVLEERERLRGDREIGLARGQYDLIRRGHGYDLEVDAWANTPIQIAQQIREAFEL